MAHYVITADPIDVQTFAETGHLTPALRDALRYARPVPPKFRTPGGSRLAAVLRPTLERLATDDRVILAVPKGATLAKVARCAYDWGRYRGLTIATRSDGVAVHVFVLARPGVPVTLEAP